MRSNSDLGRERTEQADHDLGTSPPGAESECGQQPPCFGDVGQKCGQVLSADGADSRSGPSPPSLVTTQRFGLRFSRPGDTPLLGRAGGRAQVRRCLRQALDFRHLVSTPL